VGINDLEIEAELSFPGQQMSWPISAFRLFDLFLANHPEIV
jgi:hypothetical protein